MSFFYKFLIIFIGCNILSPPVPAAPARIDAHINNGGYVLTRGGRVIASLNADKPFIPASITKIITSLAALSRLGPEYRFRTLFYYDLNHNLFIKGCGDPFLISEEVELICQNLHDLGMREINNIIIDPTNFAISRQVDGSGDSLNPYDVDNGALVVNFNTVNIVVARSGRVTSAESQTPTLPVMARLGQGLPPGTHRINICDDKGNASQHAGELFSAILAKKHIPVRGSIKEGPAPAGKAFYTHKSSRTLEEIIKAMLQYSNNYIANQISLTLGARVYGLPATWEKSRLALHAFILDDLDLTVAQIDLWEGSGLSRHNHLTPQAMRIVLDRFKPHADLLPQKAGNLIKTGTLSGVYSYAGYFPGPTGLDSFVLILNQKKNNRRQILKLLQDLHKR